MESVPLEPVDSLTVTTLVDNVTDLLLGDEGPATRWPIAHAVEPRVPARFLEPGRTGDALRAEHGFSCLVTIEKAGRVVRGPVRRRPDSRRAGGEHAPPRALPGRHRHHRAQPRSLGPHDGDGRPRAGARPPERARPDPPGVLEPPQARAAGPRAGRAAHHEQERARGRGLRDRRAGAALVPARRVAAGHRRGRPHDRVRAGLPDPRGLPATAGSPTR